jgi:NADH pyrophosphatase NudC (nudix superfamily)
MKFCSTCGSASIGLRIPEGDTIERIVCAECETIHYQNPRVVVGSIPVWEDKILLCKRAIEPRLGLWTLPAGFLENGETVEQGAMPRGLWRKAQCTHRAGRSLHDDLVDSRATGLP